MNVLIVDDSRAMRMIVQRALRQTGLKIEQFFEAENGKQALEAVAQHQPDWILSDWNMPEMTGIEFLRALRGGGNATKFGFVTSQSAPEVRDTALEAGAQFLITKPFTPEAFEKALRR
jgi:two-component system chemotaxis response regulator CheY